MKPYRQVTGRVAPLPRANVDTDQIIPAAYLKRVERTGYGQFLFQSWRTGPDGAPDPHFVLNDPRYYGATILVTGPNFGCGSSREHAAWALLDHGFRTIVAPSFADIFRANCLQNGVLPVTLPAPAVQEIITKALNDEAYRVTVDLEKCTVEDTTRTTNRFVVDSFGRECLLHGFDAIGLALRHEAQISAYEHAHNIGTNARGAP